MKRESKQLDGTPSKKMYWSIISDYNLRTGICELVDNALDIWLMNGRNLQLKIDLELDVEQQTIAIIDCAGGVPEESLENLIAPGLGGNSRDEHIIGIFGVGSKRAVIALAENVCIQSRHANGKTFQIDIDEHWLDDESWTLPAYEISEIEEGTTSVELSRLRTRVSDDDVEVLRRHLSEVYGYFLTNPKFEITLNGEAIEPFTFETWAYPPECSPRYFLIELVGHTGEKVGVELTAGLIGTKEVGKEDYGVYFYCNNRLIEKEIKRGDVGYVPGLAGLPHSDASLARIIVKLHGATKHMPWNSSKSAVNFNHRTCQALQEYLLPVVKDYSSLSRRFKGQWEEKVFAFSEGEIEHIDVTEIGKIKRSYLPPLPRVRKLQVESMKLRNKRQIQDQPWTLGLIEAMAAVDIIDRQRIETKNRIALILLDSNFEIALKEFIVHRTDLFPPNQFNDAAIAQLFSKRHEVINAVIAKVTIPPVLLAKVKHYYLLRNKLIHERATVGIIDADIANYKSTIQEILKILFDIDV